MYASALALSTIDEVFDEEFYPFIHDIVTDHENEDHKRMYTKVAWWLWGMTIGGIAAQILMLLFRGRYLGGQCKSNFLIFAITVSFVNT